MKITAVKSVCFSPTGNTEKAVRYAAHFFAEALGCGEEHISFTCPQERSESSFEKTQLVIFGVPVYAGRVPNKALPLIRSLFKADGSPAVAVVTYGNRDFGSALTELRNELSEQGFQVFAGASLVAEHSMSDKLAKGRPDRRDQEEFTAFLSKIMEMLSLDELPVLRIPGREEVRPYYVPLTLNNEKADFLKAKPLTDESKCDRCGICVRKCPMGSIDPENPRIVRGICIKCHACIRNCPKGAKYFADEMLSSHIRYVEQNNQRRGENRFYIGQELLK